MNETDFKETAQRLKEVNSVIAELDPVLREDAWGILRSYISSAPQPNGPKRKPTPKPAGNNRRKRAQSSGGAASKAPVFPPPSSSEEKMIEEFESDKDPENLSLALAILYGRYGRGPFSTPMIKAFAATLKLDIPKRPDKTLRSRKTLRQQDGGWKIMPGGETWLKETYKVQRGKDILPSDS